MTDKYQVTTSMAGIDFSYSPREVVVVGDVCTAGVVAREYVDSWLASGLLVEYVDDAQEKEAKAKAKRSTVKTAAAQPADVEQAVAK